MIIWYSSIAYSSEESLFPHAEINRMKKADIESERIMMNNADYKLL